MNNIWSSERKEIGDIKVISGDTVEVVFNLSFDITVVKRMRLSRIIAPKLSEKGGQASKTWLTNAIANANKETKVISHKAGANYLVDVFVDGVHLNKEMVLVGVAKEYKRG